MHAVNATLVRAFAAVAAVAVAGCSMGDEADLAAQAVSTFHQMLDAGQFDAIYAASADELKKAASQKDFVALLEAVHRKLGNTKSSSEKTWNVNYQTSGRFAAARRFRHQIRSTGKRVGSIGAFSDAARPSAKHIRVSSGSITPSSHSRADA